MSKTGPTISPNRHVPVDIDEWKANEDYHNAFVLKQDQIHADVLQNSEDHGLQTLHVSAAQGKFLNLLARSLNASRILEVGTHGGYSAIWLAKALPAGGKVVTLELSEESAQVAQENLKLAQLSDVVEIIIGPAQETIKRIPSDPPFDLAFIDADKVENVTYFEQAKRLVKKGGVIIVDNVIWHARVPLSKWDGDPEVEGIRALLKYVSEDSSVDATTVATASSKGYDGFLYARRL